MTVVVFLFVLVVPVLLAPIPYPVDSVTFLAQHNAERAKFALQLMKWNTTLVNQAQALADQCTFQVGPAGTSVSVAAGTDATLQVTKSRCF